MKYRRKSKIVDAELFNEKTVQRCKDFVGSALFQDKETGKYYYIKVNRNK